LTEIVAPEIIDEKDISVSVDTRFKFITYIIFASQNLGKQLSYQFFSIFARLLGASGAQLGFLTASQNVSQTALQSYFGKLSDEIGRKIFLILGFAVSGIAFLLAAFSQSPTHLIIAIIINGLGISILAPALEGSISDNTPRKIRGAFIGNMNSLSTYYAAFVILLVGIIFFTLPTDQQLFGYRAITAFSGVNFLIGSLLAYFIQEKHVKREATRMSFSNLMEPLSDPVFKRFLILVIFWWFSMSIAWSYFPVLFADIFQLTIFELSVVNAVFSVSMGVSAYIGGKINTKWGPKYGLMLGLGSFWLFPLALAFSTTFLQVVLAQILAGSSLGMGLPSIQMYIIEISGNKTGQYSGLYFLFWGIFTFVGSLSGGILLDFLEVRIGLDQTMFLLLIGVAGFRLITGSLLFLVADTKKLNR
jgi:MFS family permease